MLRPAFLAMTTLAFAVAEPPRAAQEPALAGVRLYYGPSPETARVDLEALGKARRTIDLAGYVLTDRDVMAALGEAARRGVRIRIYLDRSESSRSGERATEALGALAETRGVEIRYKSDGREAMHLKSYLVDHRVLRTGSANFSASGERYQDNDVVLLESPVLAAAFARRFDIMWSNGRAREAAR